MTLAGSSLPSVRVEEFEGPLDLLLEEVRRQNVSIEKISIAPIAARFLKYMHMAAERNLNLDIEWVHMAATLIHWKSRSLLPPDPEAQSKPDPIRDEIIQQLLAHRKEAAEELARRRSVEDTRFSRAASLPAPELTAEPEEPTFLSVWDLMQQARDIAGWVVEHRENHRHWNQTFGVEKDEVTLTEMIEYLRAELVSSVPLDALRLLGIQPTPSHRSCLFLGMLEMAREEEVQIDQSEAFAPVWLNSPAATKENPALKKGLGHTTRTRFTHGGRNTPP